MWRSDPSHVDHSQAVHISSLGMPHSSRIGTSARLASLAMEAPDMLSSVPAPLLPTRLRITSNSIQDAQDWKVLFHIRVADNNNSPPMIKILRAKPQNNGPENAEDDVVATIRYRRLSAQPDITLNIMGAELIMTCRGNGKPIQYTFESCSAEEKTLAARRTWVMGVIQKGDGYLRDASEGENEIAELKDGNLKIWRQELQQEEIMEIVLTALAVTEWGNRKWRGGNAKGAALSALLNCVVS